MKIRLRPHSVSLFLIGVVCLSSIPEELEAHENPPTLTGSVKAEELKKLTDGQLDTQARFAGDRASKGKPWLLFSYAKPFPARSIHVGHLSGKSNATLYSSQDGERFKKVVEMKPSFRTGKIYYSYDTSFPVVTARYFKLEFDTPTALTSVDLAAFARIPSWLGQSALARRTRCWVTSATSSGNCGRKIISNDSPTSAISTGSSPTSNPTEMPHF